MLTLKRLQVQDLHESLHEAGDVMSENERMLSDFQSANSRQSREMNEVSKNIDTCCYKQQVQASWY